MTLSFRFGPRAKTRRLRLVPAGPGSRSVNNSPPFVVEWGGAAMSRLLAFGVFLALFLADGVTPALAAGADKASEATFVLQIVLLVVLGRAFGEGMQRIGQPAVMGQIAAGIVLGPPVLGSLWPSFQAKPFPPDPVQMSMIDG